MHYALLGLALHRENRLCQNFCWAKIHGRAFRISRDYSKIYCRCSLDQISGREGSPLNSLFSKFLRLAFQYFWEILDIVSIMVK